MRFPSLAGLTAGTQRVLARFPETLLAAVAAAVLAVLSTRSAPAAGAPPWWAATGLGISALFSIAMLSEGLGARGAGRFTVPRIALDALAAAGLIAVALAWPGWSESVRAHRLVHFALATHLLASFAPFVLRHRPNAFWQYNRALFTRFLVGGLYSAVLFAGLAIALAASKPLFGFAVSERMYVTLWFIIVFVFNTGYFLAGVPEDLDALDADTSYPGGLRVFAQFVLVPLVALYLVILTAYLVKVLVTGQWPNGWIGWLVSSVSAAGLLAILLVHPVRDREENRWVSRFTRVFHLALLPSIAMLFAAIGKRIGQYGFTEERYYLLALALWITGIAIGYSLRHRADIRWIPIALCALTVVTAFGPWGAYTLSRWDQAARLQRMLTKHALFVDGRLQPATRALDFADQKALSGALEYLAGTHGIAALPGGLRTVAEADSAYRASDLGTYGRTGLRGELVAQAVMRGLGLGYVPKWQSLDTQNLNYSMAQRTGLVEDVGGYEHVVSFDGVPPFEFRVEGQRGRLELRATSQLLRLSDDRGHAWDFALDSLVADLKRGRIGLAGAARDEPYRLQASSQGVPARLVITGFVAPLRADALQHVNLRAQLFLRGWSDAPRP